MRRKAVATSMDHDCRTVCGRACRININPYRASRWQGPGSVFIDPMCEDMQPPGQGRLQRAAHSSRATVLLGIDGFNHCPSQPPEGAAGREGQPASKF